MAMARDAFRFVCDDAPHATWHGGMSSCMLLFAENRAVPGAEQFPGGVVPPRPVALRVPAAGTRRLPAPSGCDACVQPASFGCTALPSSQPHTPSKLASPHRTPMDCSARRPQACKAAPWRGTQLLLNCYMVCTAHAAHAHAPPTHPSIHQKWKKRNANKRAGDANTCGALCVWRRACFSTSS